MKLSKGDIFRWVFYLGVIILLAVLQPKEIDWSSSYDIDDTKPYGIKALYDIYNNAEAYDIQINNETMYSALQDSLKTGADILFINPSLALDKLDQEKLLAYVFKGNTCLMVTNKLPHLIRDSLVLDYIELEEWASNIIPKDTLTTICAEDSLSYELTKSFTEFSWEENDTATYKTLAFIDEQAIVIRKDFGEGRFYFCSTPILFTNYHLLNNDGAFVEKVLSYLPNKHIIWDQYYLAHHRGKQTATPFYALFEYPNFKWAYWLTFITIILFYLIKSKRLQRAIPTIEPYRNTTSDFVHTVSNLYYHERDNHAISLKKIKHFKENLAQNYYMRDIVFSDSEAELLSQKIGADMEKMKLLFRRIRAIMNRDEVSDQMLKILNDRLAWFYKL